MLLSGGLCNFRPCSAGLANRPACNTRCTRNHRSLTCLAGKGNGSEGEPSPDIDALASFLTQQAAEMRRQLSSSSDEDDILNAITRDDDPDTPGGQAEPQMALPDLPVAAPDIELSWEEGGFVPQDFAIYRTLGQLSMQQRTSSTPDLPSLLPVDSDAPDETTTATSSSSSPPPAAAVYVYAARYNSGMPYEGPLTMTLREYPAGVRPVGLTELMVQKRLLGGLPRNKWQAGAEDPTPTPPVVQLLGYFEASPSDPAYEATANGADSLWLVYKFEGLRPLALMLQQVEPPRIQGGPLMWFKGRDAAASAALEGRYRLLRGISKGILSALSYCHSRGVAHCSLGPGSVLLSSWQDSDVWRLLVKLDNWGLAKVYGAALPGEVPDSPALIASSSSGASSSGSRSVQDTDAADQQMRDLQAACLLVCEVLLVGLAPEGASIPDTLGLQRLLFDVFHEDVEQFREYCSQEEDLGAFVEFMDADDGAGWEMLKQLLTGKVAAGQLLRLPFFEAT